MCFPSRPYGVWFLVIPGLMVSVHRSYVVVCCLSWTENLHKNLSDPCIWWDHWVYCYVNSWVNPYGLTLGVWMESHHSISNELSHAELAAGLTPTSCIISVMALGGYCESVTPLQSITEIIQEGTWLIRRRSKHKRRSGSKERPSLIPQETLKNTLKPTPEGYQEEDPNQTLWGI